MVKEIVTVQIGNVSNFIGAHWWNIQESAFVFNQQDAVADETRINHEILFREGKNLRDQLTFCPRVIAIDDKDNVGSSSVLNFLYADDQHSNKRVKSSWPGNLIVADQSKRKNEFLLDLEKEIANSSQIRVDDKFYNLDNSVSTWTDFLRVPYHPKSLLSLNEISSNDVLTRYDLGNNISQSSGIGDLIESKFRFFSEECDALQGFHVVSDIHDAFSAVGSRIAEYLRDEYGRTTIVCFPVIHDSLLSKEDFDWPNFHWNTCRALSEIANRSDVIVPLSLRKRWSRRSNVYQSFEHLLYKPNLVYHSSAIIAAALETASTPWRLSNNPDALSDVCTFLTDGIRKFGVLHTDMPFVLNGLKSVSSTNGIYPFSPLSPFAENISSNNAAPSIEKFMLSMRGVKNLQFSEDISSKNELTTTDRIKKLNEIIFKCFAQNRFSFSLTNEPIYTKSPFPHVFADHVDRYGNICQTKRQNGQAVQCVPVLSKLESNAKSLNFVNNMFTEFESIDFRKFHIDVEHLDVIKESLNTLRDVE